MTDDPLPATDKGEALAPRIPKVVTQYSSAYKPPFNVTRLIERMLESVPPKYLVGLSEVVLTNASGLSRARRRGVTKSRRKKVKILNTRGLYHPAWQGRRAWIEIFVDTTLRLWEKGFWLKISFFREMDLGDVLFHELGHHIHYAVRPEYSEEEDVADVWKVRLHRNYTQRRHRLLKVIARIVQFTLGPIYRAIYLRVMRQQLGKGWMSRAEFEESIR